jgi:putative lipoprotein (rSAM/lipoprotein system)
MIMKKVGLILKLLATGTLTMMLAACYGTIQAMYGVPYSRRSGVIKVQRNDTTPIPGIKVMYTTDPNASSTSGNPGWQPLGHGYTTPDGILQYSEYLDYHEQMYAMLVDVDGVENGGPYTTLVITVDETEEIVTMIENEPMPEEF